MRLLVSEKGSVMFSVNTFGPTGISVLPLGLGTHGHGSAFGPITRDSSLAVLEDVYARVPVGQKVLIDTAPRYGHGLVESWLGELSNSWSDRFVIATKCGRRIDPKHDNQKDFSYVFLESEVEASLRRLRSDRLFLTQLHNPSLDEIKSGEIFASMEKLRERGLIDWYGLSINDPIEGIEAIRTCTAHEFSGLAAIQFIYNIFTKEKARDLLREAQASQIALIAREVLFRGFLSDKFLTSSRENLDSSAVVKLTKEYGLDRIRDSVLAVKNVVSPFQVPIVTAALRYSIETPGVTTTLVGANKPQYLAEAWSALDTPLPTQLRDALDRIPDIQPSRIAQAR